MADGEAEARFAHLLQPIRDLARNWDIDIASSLEDYLEELDQLKISLDGGEANLNFAEAALLIQGTACIYSRKVEYLHSLVFQVLDRLSSSQGQQGGKGRRGGGGQGGDGDGKGDDDAHLLGGGGAGDPLPLLDSLLEEGRPESIDLKPQLVLASLKAAAATANGTNSTAGGGGSKNGPAPHCRPPLLVMEECNASFKAATCAVHKSGALLMEESLRRELEPTLAAEEKGKHSYDLVYGQGGQGQEEEEEEMDQMGGADAAWVGGGGGGGDDDFRMDDDNDGPPPEEEAPPPQEQGQREEEKATEGAMPMQVEQAAQPLQQRELRSRRNTTQQEQEQEEEEEEEEEEEDPWAPLDPHDPGKAPARPFRKGRAPKAPPMPTSSTSSSTTTAPSAAAAAASAILTGLTFPEFAPLVKALEAQSKRRTRARRAAAPNNKPSSLEDDRRASGRRRSMALYAAISAPATVAEGRVAAAAAAAAMGPADGGDDLEEEEDDDDVMGGADAAWGAGGGDDDDFRMDDDHDYAPTYNDDMEGEGAAAIAIGGALEGGMMRGNRRGSYAPVVSLEEGGLLDDAFAGAAQSYEALCRKHMDAFMRGLEAYAHETQLTRRVADWQDKVEPMLEVQERRTPFDIHDCGDEILSTLATATGAEGEEGGKENGVDAGNEDAAAAAADAATTKGKDKDKEGSKRASTASSSTAAEAERSFQEIVSGKEQYEVCRLFLASLQLANNGNVQLVHEAGPQDKDGTSFRLNLLSDQRMHQRFVGTELGDIDMAH